MCSVDVAGRRLRQVPIVDFEDLPAPIRKSSGRARTMKVVRRYHGSYV